MEFLGEIMFCENCGAENDDKRKFCENCGTKLRAVSVDDYKEAEENAAAEEKPLPYQPTRPAYKKKQLYVHILLIFFPGLGHVYVDRPFLGFGYIFGVLITGAIAAAMLEEGYVTLSVIFFVIFGFFYLFVLVDGFRLTLKFNKFVDENLRAPRPDEKWWKTKKKETEK